MLVLTEELGRAGEMLAKIHGDLEKHFNQPTVEK
jgi:hypothetical protein